MPRISKKEQLADNAHKALGLWMEYLLSKCSATVNGEMVIPAYLVKEFDKRISTKYSDLPENEKELFRADAERILGIVK